MLNQNLLDEYIKKSGLKLSYIANQLGISTFALLNKRNGVTEFKPSEITALCDMIGVDSFSTIEQIFFTNVVDSESSVEES